MIALRWRGLKELRRDLRTLPADMTDDARPIVLHSATDAKAAMFAKYPKITGRLAGGLLLQELPAGPTRAAQRLSNETEYAAYFEFGTRYTAPGRVFVPILWAYQRVMVRQVSAILPKWNFRVRGSVDA